MGDCHIGSLPSSVYRMVAPDVAEEIVTLCEDVYAPPAGTNEGVAAVPRFKLYVAVVGSLVVHPVRQPFTRSVVVFVMAIVLSAAMIGSLNVGSAPFVV